VKIGPTTTASAFVLTLVLVLPPILPLSGAEPPPSGLCGSAFAHLAQAHRRAVPLSAHFRHVLVAQTLNQTEVEEGTLTLAPGGKMRWEYTQPPGKLAVSDGKASTLFLPESREVFIQPLAAGPDEPLLFRLLSGRVSLEEEMACEGVALRGDQAVLTLRLLKADAEIPEVEVTTEAATGRVLQVRYHDALGNEVSLSLSDLRTPAALPESLFTFTIPEGARVFRR